MCYENIALFEKLAGKGYVVLSINSIGRYPGDMTMKHGDMMEQVYDAISSLKFLEKSPNIDFSKIGIIGYSWGGLSGTVLANKISNTACLISLMVPNFTTMDKAKTRMPTLIVSGRVTTLKNEPANSLPAFGKARPGQTPRRIITSYNFSEKLAGDKIILTVDSTEHQDFAACHYLLKHPATAAAATLLLR
jgi:alpha/beta superfamily hydrolase